MKNSFFKLFSSVLVFCLLVACSGSPAPEVQDHRVDEQKANAEKAQQELSREISKQK